MKKATELAAAANPDIIDINYGCPVKKVACKGAGAGILQDIPKMVRMTAEIVKSTNLPVTVKTRLGWDNNSLFIEEIAERLQDVGIKALSIHGRTRVQMYKGEADWTLIGRIKENPNVVIPIFGNGDINSPEKLMEYKKRYGVDGVMIGRASIGNPWVFDQLKHFMHAGTHLPTPGIKERVDVAKEHLDRSIKWKGERVGVVEMRRHYANYFKGIPDFKPVRTKLVTTDDVAGLYEIFEDILCQFA